MKVYRTDEIRNVVLLGHGGSGKTSLAEAMAYVSGATNRMGSVENGNTISDFDKEEQKRKFSLSTSLIPIEWEKAKINILDTPGYFDFVGEQIQGMRACDVAMIVVCGAAGVEVGTEKAWSYVNNIKLPRTFFINKLDRENSDYDKTLAQLKEKFGISVVPISILLEKNQNLRES